MQTVNLRNFAAVMLKIAWHENYAHPLPEGHRFPMRKYELIPMQLMYEGVVTQDNLFTPALASTETITLTHDADYWHRMQTLQLTEREMRAVGFPLTTGLVQRKQQ